MLRISLFVMLVALMLPTATVAAREAGLGNAVDETCAEKQDAGKKIGVAPASTIGSRLPARETRAKAGNGDAPSGRVQSPRWHSFLPGMFR